jgi:CheY-like chemotaxis protein
VSDHLTERPIVIIEDNDEDNEVTVWVPRQAGATNLAYRCRNAVDIANLLTSRSDWPPVLSGPFPLLVFLDLSIPGADWKETLGSLRNNVWWQQVPVLILSTSAQPDVVAACYAAGAAAFWGVTLRITGCGRLSRRFDPPAEKLDSLLIHQVISADAAALSAVNLRKGRSWNIACGHYGGPSEDLFAGQNLAFKSTVARSTFALTGRSGLAREGDYDTSGANADPYQSAVPLGSFFSVIAANRATPYGIASSLKSYIWLCTEAVAPLPNMT